MMANPLHHAISSANRWGGEPGEYLAIHRWFDRSKELHGDFRHRALYHHAHGIFEMEREFGPALTLSTGKTIPTRWVGEQHVVEDCGFIPSVSDWLGCVRPERWMNAPRKLSEEQAREAAVAPART